MLCVGCTELADSARVTAERARKGDKLVEMSQLNLARETRWEEMKALEKLEILFVPHHKAATTEQKMEQVLEKSGPERVCRGEKSGFSYFSSVVASYS